MGAREREQYINLAATRWARRQRLAGVDERGRTLNPTIGQRILIELAFTADKDGVSLMGQSSLAEACQCAKRTVVAWLMVLEEAGLVSRSNRGLTGSVKGGGRTSDQIRLAFSQSAPGAVSPPEVKVRPVHFEGPVKVRRAQLTGQSAPGAGQSAPGAPSIKKLNNNPLNPPIPNPSIEGARRKALGFTCPRCEALPGYPCVGRNMRERQQPHVERHRRAVGGNSSSGLGTGGAGRDAGAPAAAMRRVNPDHDPELWRRLCEVTDHALTMTGKDGAWPFDASLVAELEAEL